MCDPVSTAIAVGTTIAGSVLQSRAANKASNKIEGMRKKTNAANDELLTRSQNEQQGAAQEFNPDNFNADTAATTGKLENDFLSNLSSGFGDLDMQDTPQIVQQSDAKAKAKTDMFAQNFAKALANLRGFNQNMLNQRVNIGRVGENTQMNSGFIQGNSNALNSDISRVDASSPLGDLLTGVGGAALSYGAGGGGVGSLFGSPSIPVINGSAAPAGLEMGGWMLP